MALRPAKCYRKHERPNTRVSTSRPRKSYVKGVPGIKIHRFEHGNKDKSYSMKMYLRARQQVQIRHNALEAARVSISKDLAKTVGEESFFIKVLVYPHHVLRENPLATGAGADRFQTGMRKSFGRPISKAARVKEGQNIIEIRLDKKNIRFGKKALKIGAAKVPTACIIEMIEKKSS